MQIAQPLLEWTDSLFRDGTQASLTVKRLVIDSDQAGSNGSHYSKHRCPSLQS